MIALLACVGSMSAQDTALSVSTPEPQVIIKPQHFGYLSYNEALHAMPEYAEAMKSIAELKASYDNEMNRAETEFSKKFTEYLDGQKSFPENIMLKRQKELQILMEQSITFKKEAKELLTKSEDELLAPIKSKLTDAIRAVGKEHNYAYILNTDANAYPYISGEGEAENCTDAVLSELGIK